MIQLFRPYMNTDRALQKLANILTYNDDGSLYIGQGEKVEEFEKDFQAYCKLEDTPLSVNSCTSALELAAQLIGFDRDSIIITTPQTCTATQTPIALYGSHLVWSDIDPLTGLMTIESTDRLVGKYGRRVKAIITVNWAGRQPDYKRLKQYGIPVIEDAAHGPFERKVSGDYITWSFQAIKHLTTIDGGMLLPPKDQIERARLLRWYGFDRRSSQDFRCAQNVQEFGRKIHMNDINASIGLANIVDLPMVEFEHKDNALFYCEHINNQKITIPPYDSTSSYWIFTILVDERDRFKEYMGSKGIATSQVHARNDMHDAFKRIALNQEEYRPGLEYFDKHQVSVPVGWWVSDEERTYIVDTINKWR